MYIKYFDAWFKIKKDINKSEEDISINAGDVRWASLGVNIGSEIDGKGKSFTRPVIILKVIGNNLALILPMSTKLKGDVPGYLKILLKEKEVSVCLSQIRVISQKRIFLRIAKISENKFKNIKKEVNNFYNFI